MADHKRNEDIREEMGITRYGYNAKTQSKYIEDSIRDFGRIT